MVRLRVLKASRFLFECADVDPADAAQLQRLALAAVRAEEMAALGIQEVDVRKRFKLDEVDRLIACCERHPPEVVVAPAAPADRDQFREFSRYLSDRKRAGVAAVPDGLMLVLAPLPNTHEFMRCVVVKAATTAEGDGVVSVSSTSLSKKRPRSPRSDVAQRAAAPKISSTPSASASSTLPGNSESPCKKRSRINTHQNGSGTTAAEKSAPISALPYGKLESRMRWDRPEPPAVQERQHSATRSTAVSNVQPSEKSSTRRYQSTNGNTGCKSSTTIALRLEDERKRNREERSGPVPPSEELKAASVIPKSHHNSSKSGESRPHASQHGGSNGAARSTAVDTSAPLLPLERPRKQPRDAQPALLCGTDKSRTQFHDIVPTQKPGSEKSKIHDAEPAPAVSGRTATSSKSVPVLHSMKPSVRPRDNPLDPLDVPKTQARDVHRQNGDKLGAISSELRVSPTNAPTGNSTAEISKSKAGPKSQPKQEKQKQRDNDILDRLCPSIKTFDSLSKRTRRKFSLTLRNHHADYNETYFSVLQAWSNRANAAP